MTVLVLGSAGYIGSHVVNQFITNGYDVAVIDHLLSGHIESFWSPIFKLRSLSLVH